ncbi:hypothetical protein FE783_13330 [Paenibacillus mesophilus]|uniref:hypothetical protein n=1 Tax=Paenibacillus mesophilus TaxID=2582849 RepID=UPI00110F6196|nr:hypothetical protein [Paenibacillus mesophilus]TMV49484.1 hypothetical protein FE783_13330 [Paenibacillus mesophilus]
MSTDEGLQAACAEMPVRPHGKAGDALVYRFGGEGNDWCFVRLPYQYDPDGKPHPWILCNHGNGWVMDGTERKANWSEKTQYGVDTQNDGAYLHMDAPGYRRYSNPTIEAFLRAGYVVCGAQNDGDLLYGNDNCTRACASFYQHMVETYRVERKCFILGASNGFMTTVGAVRTLGADRVLGIIGQYPLCHLRHAFMHTHREGIKRAFGIASDDIAEFESKAEDADPCRAPVSGTEDDAVSKWPPTLLVWSSTDQVLPMEEHAVKYAALLRARGIAVDDIRVDQDGETCLHGSYKHFLPETFVSWCRTVRTRDAD